MELFVLAAIAPLPYPPLAIPLYCLCMTNFEKRKAGKDSAQENVPGIYSFCLIQPAKNFKNFA